MPRNGPIDRSTSGDDARKDRRRPAVPKSDAWIAAIAKRAGQGLRGAAKARVEAFVPLYFRGVDPEVIAQRDTESLACEASAFLDFGARRRPRQPKIRVFNPEEGSRSAHGGHTVVEIINDDMPFLVDSVTAALNRSGMTPRLIIHPVPVVKRDRSGQLLRIAPPGAAGPDFRRESWIHMVIERQGAAVELAQARNRIRAVLKDVRAAVEDWMPMRAQVAEIIRGLPTAIEGIDSDDIDEARDFLRWIDDDHFTFLGYRRYDFSHPRAGRRASIVDGTGLGLLRDPEVRVFADEESDVLGTARVSLVDQGLISVTKANRRSTVHRPVHMDSIGIRIAGPGGETVGEHRLIGLFTSHAYNLSPRFIPLLRQRIGRVMARSGFDPGSHDGKALLHILETYPRDEMFQIGEAELLSTAMGILHLQGRQRTRLFTRHDPLGRFVSCLVFTPREEFGTTLRERFQEILSRAMGGTISAFYIHIGDEPLARVQFIVKTSPKAPPSYDLSAVERDLAAAARSWTDELHDRLIALHGESRGLALFTRFSRAFPFAYRDRFSPSLAVIDIDKIEAGSGKGVIGLNLYRRQGADEDDLRLKIVHPGGPLPLSDALPLLENMGLRVMEEVPFSVTPSGGEAVWIHDFVLRRRAGGDRGAACGDFPALKALFEEALSHVFGGALENDAYNQLVLSEGLDWRQVGVIRAYSKYLRQVRVPFSQDYMIDVFARNPGFARRLVDLFAVRHDPDPAMRGHAESRAVTLKVAFEDALESVRSLDDDRILRRFLNAVAATLRTNFYRKAEDGGPRPCLALKFDSAALDGLPLPRPWREVFVYSPRMEGVHLRGGPVARGGIRWSDRREDFRTEILGLMKAQMIKNAVIVPVGAKGGFVVKRPPADAGREAVQAEGVACYRLLIQGLLDVTDNRVGASVVPPPDLVRHDGDDPYLVVAADKGTATFSDIANALSRENGFWLDDAFASGGSVGYDHKKMGITARGAWESVKRHFREMGRDIQSEPFSVVGVGDMSGDVFGNGMLLSRQTRLVAAFNHLHVFLDPDPDPVQSLRERRRLFRRARSSWSDYDPSCLSPGGGVFERSAKSIPLSPEVRTLLGVSHAAMAPEDLIRALLCLPVDLLWFGGIGTFVRARHESDAEVGDRANDAVRVCGADLGCKVIGEGANLGMTQAGRIEYARAGGRLNTDAIDNSAGVDCSDHEVNIKILLTPLVAEGRLAMRERDRLLKAMTDEVASLVLRDNYDQTQALGMVLSSAAPRHASLVRLIRALERAGRLDRKVEGLPNDEALEALAAAGKALTRPELAVLLAHAKLMANDALAATDLAEDPFLARDLLAYFPAPLRKAWPEAIAAHRLRRELIHTALANQIVNRAGPDFITDLQQRSGADAAAVARAFLVVRDGFDCPALWARIESLDNKVPAHVQTAMLRDLRDHLETAVLWLLRHGDHPLSPAEDIARIRPGIESLCESLSSAVTAETKLVLGQRRLALTGEGVPKDLAGRIAVLPFLAPAFDILRLARDGQDSIPAVARLYFHLGGRFGFDWLSAAAARIEPTSSWQRQALEAMADEASRLLCRLATQVIDLAGVSPAADALIEAWSEARQADVVLLESLIDEARKADGADIAMLTVILGQMRRLAER